MYHDEPGFFGTLASLADKIGHLALVLTVVIPMLVAAFMLPGIDTSAMSEIALPFYNGTMILALGTAGSMALGLVLGLIFSLHNVWQEKKLERNPQVRIEPSFSRGNDNFPKNTFIGLTAAE